MFSIPVDVKTLAILLHFPSLLRVLTLESSKGSLASARSPRVGVFVFVSFFVLNQNCVWFLLTLLIVLITEMNTFLPYMESEHPLWWNLSFLVKTEATENKETARSTGESQTEVSLESLGKWSLGSGVFSRGYAILFKLVVPLCISTIQTKWQPVHKGLAYKVDYLVLIFNFFSYYICLQADTDSCMEMCLPVIFAFINVLPMDHLGLYTYQLAWPLPS